MCGRYVLTTPGEVLAQLFELPAAPALAPRYNIAPTQPVPIVRAAESGERELALVHWGLIPHWAKEREIGNRMINARAETLAEKPAFRDSFRKRRCLIPASGFFEWKLEGKAKQPYLLRLRGGAPFAFAGLWSRWREPGHGEEGVVDSCAIVTTSPNELAATVHDRMPAMLPAGDYAAWLDPTTGVERLAALLAPFAAAAMEAFPVSTWVNSPAHDDAGCLRPLAR